MKHANKVNMQFSYVNSAATDIRKLFARERKLIAAEAAAKQTAETAAKSIAEAVRDEALRKCVKLQRKA